MKRYHIPMVALLSVLTATVARGAPPAGLPPDLQAIRQQVIDISRDNTTRNDNIPATRAILNPLVEQLATWFNANRPDNELALTQVPWKSIWYDDPTIDGFSNVQVGPLSLTLNKDRVFQVVEDGFYYNVSENIVRLGPFSLKLRSFLKGAYTVANPATASNAGQPKLNVVDLEFVANSIKVRGLSADTDLRALVQGVDSGEIRTQSVPGPIGITGELWNLYIDEELRISAGFEDEFPDILDLYILLRAQTPDALAAPKADTNQGRIPLRRLMRR